MFSKDVMPWITLGLVVLGGALSLKYGGRQVFVQFVIFVAVLLSDVIWEWGNRSLWPLGIAVGAGFLGALVLEKIFERLWPSKEPSI